MLLLPLLPDTTFVWTAFNTIECSANRLVQHFLKGFTYDDGTARCGYLASRRRRGVHDTIKTLSTVEPPKSNQTCGVPFKIASAHVGKTSAQREGNDELRTVFFFYSNAYCDTQ